RARGQPSVHHLLAWSLPLGLQVPDRRIRRRYRHPRGPRLAAGGHRTRAGQDRTDEKCPPRQLLHRSPAEGDGPNRAVTSSKVDAHSAVTTTAPTENVTHPSMRYLRCPTRPPMVTGYPSVLDGDRVKIRSRRPDRKSTRLNSSH